MVDTSILTVHRLHLGLTSKVLCKAGIIKQVEWFNIRDQHLFFKSINVHLQLLFIQYPCS